MSSNLPIPSSINDIMLALGPLMRQLDRLDERTKDLATRTDLESLRKELVAREALEPRLAELKANTLRIETDLHIEIDRVHKRIDEAEKLQLSKQDRLWVRLGQIGALVAILLSLFELLSHVRFIP